MRERVEGCTVLTNGTDESRWTGIKRPYSPADVLRFRGSLQIEHTMARRGAERLWKLLHAEPYVAALGALTGNQAIEQVRAGLLAIYASGLQASPEGNGAHEMFPDESLYSSETVPNLVRNINKSLLRSDQIHFAEGNTDVHWFAPIIADAAGRFGDKLTAFELTKAMIEAGAAAVHFDDQIAGARKSPRTGGKIIVPTHTFIEKMIAARLAADVMGTPTVLIACTSGATARFIESACDPYDAPFIMDERTADGYLGFRGGLGAAIARGIAYAPYADLLWYDTVAPDLKEARRFADAVHAKCPGKLLAYNCSSSFNWSKQLDATTVRNFHVALSGMGYRLQFVTLAGFHSLNVSMFDLARGYREIGMAAYARLQQNESELAESYGYEAVSHQQFLGAGYFDGIAQTIAGSTFSDATAVEPANGEKSGPQFPAKTAPAPERAKAHQRSHLLETSGFGVHNSENSSA